MQTASAGSVFGLASRPLQSMSVRQCRIRNLGMAMDVKDSNGNVLSDGDSVTLIKDLKVKGTSVTLKRGTLVKNIRLTEDEEEVECNIEKVKGLVLKACFVKKA